MQLKVSCKQYSDIEYQCSTIFVHVILKIELDIS